VEGGTARRLSRLQPERQGPDDLLGLFGAPGAGCTRLGAARLEEVAECEPADFTVSTMPGRFAAIGDPHAGIDAAAGSLETLLEHAARDEGTASVVRLAAALSQDGRRGVRVAPSRAKGAARKPRARMPLVIVANSPDKEAALAGLERWKGRHPEAARYLAVDEVLVDSMRGRFSTWTRIRVNLCSVPEAIRPVQETPDPDDDPTRNGGARRDPKARKQR